jgi:chromosome segregation ATPase
MFKKMIDLQASLQAEKARLESDIIELQDVLEAPAPEPFDEFTAASRITQAKTKDHLEGSKTAEALTKAVDKERAEAAKKQEAYANQVADITKKLTPKKAQLASIDSEIAALGWKVKALIKDAANERLSAAIEGYQLTAAALLKALIEIDALKAALADDPSENPARYVLLVESLPALSADTLEHLDPWQLLASGEKLIFPKAAALAAVSNRQLAITEEIKGALYGQ